MDGYIVLIPAYKPDEKLLTLVRALHRQHIDILIVDDGSGPQFAELFNKTGESGATVLRHEKNEGKGAAIKTGIRKVMQDESILGVITADADGQHTVHDICRIIKSMQESPGLFILGARSFTGDVPAKSRVGNKITRYVFNFATGMKVTDTQTGLRGIPKNLFPYLIDLEGNRYEYEMNMLLNLSKWGAEYKEVPIQTVYIEHNASSHFRPFKDSLCIYGRIFKFLISSLLSFVIDYAAFALLYSAFKFMPWLSYVLARVISSFVNYSINRHIVFGSAGRHSFAKYYYLALCILIAGSFGVELLTKLAISGLLAKIIVDVPLFFVSYMVQQKYIFNPKSRLIQE